jgi:hypothetical protein
VAAQTPVPVPAAPAYERLPPAAPPPESWWENPWPAVVAGILALLLGGFVGYAIGHKGESQHGAGATHTVTNTMTVVHPKTVVQTNTVTASTVKETPSPTNQANEARLSQAEASLRKAEKENGELKGQLEESGRSP